MLDDIKLIKMHRIFRKFGLVSKFATVEPKLISGTNQAKIHNFGRRV